MTQASALNDEEAAPPSLKARHALLKRLADVVSLPASRINAFERAVTARHYSGLGLGLFIVRQIVERNKGRITVESTVGKGTTFFLDFPAAKEAAATPALQRS